MAEHIITGIDIGTYNVKVAIARIPKNASDQAIPEIIGTGFAESRGLKSGYINQSDEVARSVKSAIAQAEKAAGVIVKRPHVAIGSIGLEETYSRGGNYPSYWADSEISAVDVEKVMQDSEDRIIDHIPNRKILHNIPLRYTIDGTEVMGRPQGMHGTKLEADVLLLHHTSNI